MVSHQNSTQVCLRLGDTHGFQLLPRAPTWLPLKRLWFPSARAHGSLLGYPHIWDQLWLRHVRHQGLCWKHQRSHHGEEQARHSAKEKTQHSYPLSQNGSSLVWWGVAALTLLALYCCLACFHYFNTIKFRLTTGNGHGPTAVLTHSFLLLFVLMKIWTGSAGRLKLPVILSSACACTWHFFPRSGATLPMLFDKKSSSHKLFKVLYALRRIWWSSCLPWMASRPVTISRALHLGAASWTR